MSECNPPYEGSQYEFLVRLSLVLKEDTVTSWLRTKNPTFQGKTPQELLDQGTGESMKPLWEMLFYLESGIPS